MKPKALTPAQARTSLVQRLGKTADNVRQVATRVGARPYRVFLTWTRWTGEEVGEGVEEIVRRVEILPTPVVKSLDNLTYSPFGAGVVPEGSLRISDVSVVKFTSDILKGLMVPDVHIDNLPKRMQFFYEVVEDGRGDPCPVRQKFRLMGEPMRNATGVSWMFALDRASQDRSRDDKSSIGQGTQG